MEPKEINKLDFYLKRKNYKRTKKEKYNFIKYHNQHYNQNGQLRSFIRSKIANYMRDNDNEIRTGWIEPKTMTWWDCYSRRKKTVY